MKKPATAVASTGVDDVAQRGIEPLRAARDIGWLCCKSYAYFTINNQRGVMLNACRAGN